MKHNFKFYDVERMESVAQIVENSKNLYGDSPAIKYKKKKIAYEKSYNELFEDSHKFAKKLLEEYKNVKHIAILGPSSYEWVVTYLGIAAAGLVAVPLDKELNTEKLVEQLKQADVDCLVFDECLVKTKDEILSDINIETISMDKILENIDDAIELPKINPNELFEIVFTSGTTGESKGVMLTQANIAANVWQGLQQVNLEHDKDVVLSILPLNHAYELTCTYLCMIFRGVPVCICSGKKYIQREIKEYAPTVMFAVPLVADTLYKKIELSVKNLNKEKAFNFITKINSMLFHMNIDISGIFLGEVKNALGGRLRELVCGGAKLEEDLISKYNGIGITMIQGYGLTECSPLLSVNLDYYQRANSVGKIVEGCEVKSVDGELWARGISVSKGYYNNERATLDGFEDGWFKTGDLGYVDKDGFIYITGRKKNLIILDNGENVSAEELESYIYKIDGVAEVLAYGENNGITAEIYLDPENKNADCDIIKKEIERLNKKLPNYKNIDDVIFREKPFEKTTTQKIKRNYR